MSQPADTTALDRAEQGPGTNLLLQGQPPLCPHTVTPSIVDAPGTAQDQQDQPSEGGSNLSDGSGALFSMYLDRAIEEDTNMVESWKGDADGMLVFVRLQTTSHTSAHNLETVDWSILCRGCSITRIVRPEYSAELAGHVIFLSRAYLSATFYPTKWIPGSHPVELVRPYPTFHTTYVGHLGQRALVHEPCHQPDLRPIGDIATAVGASLSKGCLPTLQPSQAGTYSCLLQARCRQAAYSLDG
jgi:hypothetical protein